ncbi:MAG: S9 family peptidase, partial [Acidobacteria bacterium]|nr:S9 family peptidase [Acidobacteriota bacterium]
MKTRSRFMIPRRSFRPLAAILAAGLLWAAAGPAFSDGMNPNDVAKIRTVSNVAISPDGATVAYTLSVPRRPYEDEDGPSWSELYVRMPSGEDRPFITGEVNVRSVEFTADGKALTFLSKRAGDDGTSLYRIPIDGGEARRLVKHETGIDGYSFSPDGKRVAFLAVDKEPKAIEELKKKGFKQEIFEEDGLFTRVWVLDLEAEGAEAKQLDLVGSASELSWSPVDNRLAVALKPLPLIDQEYTSRKVHVVDADTGKVLAKFDNPGKLGSVRWSPDGKHLAMLTAIDKHDPSPGRLAVVPTAGGPLQYLLPADYPGDVDGAYWLDGQRLLASVSRGVEQGLAEVALDGSIKDRLPGGQACWSDFALADDGNAVALAGDTPTHPRELFVGTLAKGVERQTDSNPWLSEKELASQEVISYPARDGQTIEAILTRPLGEKEGQRYPLIAYIHGGPEAHHCNGWLTGYSGPGQMAAARGFAVFAPNYRGSTGRGVAFAKAHQGDPAGKEFDDIVDG